jgi:hypothetical protein
MSHHRNGGRQGAHERSVAAASSPGDALIERLAERVGGQARVETVFGMPVQQGDMTIITLARVR